MLRYRQVLAGPAIGAGLWLTPSRHSALAIRERLLHGEGAKHRLAGCFNPAVHTFQQFAQMVQAQADRPQRFVGKLLKRQLIERVLGQAVADQKLEYFAPIADRPGLVDLLANLIGDLKRQEVSPTAFLKSVSSADASQQKNREVGEIYSAYQQLLDQHNLYDAEG